MKLYESNMLETSLDNHQTITQKSDTLIARLIIPRYLLETEFDI